MIARRSAPLRDHPLARGALADRANDFLTKAWAKGWLPPPELDPDALWAMASKSFDADAANAETGGRCEADVEDFRSRLERLSQSACDQARLNALGRAMAWGQLTRVIKNRLAFGRMWRANGAMLDTALAPPIIVIGHMRSGTTRIHKLLAADPAHAHTRYQDAYHPVPAARGLARMKSAFELAMLGALNPWMQSIHPMAPAQVEEELAWISAALHHSIYESQWHIPDYSAWSEARDPAPIYREFARILRTDAAHRGVADKPRVMKVPAFAEDLPALLAQFPDARLVLAQRDPQAVLKSAVSLCANQMAVQSDHCDLAQIEALWSHKITLREARMTTALTAWEGPIVRLDFDALGEDWEREMHRCYGEFGLDLTPPAIAAMRAAMAGEDTGRHKAHAQQLARFNTPASN